MIKKMIILLCLVLILSSASTQVSGWNPFKKAEVSFSTDCIGETITKIGLKDLCNSQLGGVGGSWDAVLNPDYLSSGKEIKVVGHVKDGDEDIEFTYHSESEEGYGVSGFYTDGGKFACYGGQCEVGLGDSITDSHLVDKITFKYYKKTMRSE